VQLPADALEDLEAAAQLHVLGLDPSRGRQQGLLAALQFGVERDSTVEAGGATRGAFVAGRVEQAGGWLPGSFEYASVIGDGRYYHPVAGVTFAGRLQYGSLVASARQSAVPFSQRFFLGGADSLRGWGRLEVSPLSAAGLPIGGQSLVATTGEIRLPVAGAVGAVAFVDAGRVWEDAWTLARDLHADGGIGLRIRSPVGLLRLDVARQFTTIEGPRIDGERRDRRWRVHVGLGHSF